MNTSDFKILEQPTLCMKFIKYICLVKCSILNKTVLENMNTRENQSEMFKLAGVNIFRHTNIYSDNV